MPRPDRTQTTGRAAKVAQIQKANKAAERRRGGLIWGSLALVLALIVGGVTYAIINDSSATADLGAVEDYEYAGSMHSRTAVEYAESPPVGGEHHDAWWNCGVYTEPIPDEHAVHSLEHGAVWLTYQPDLPADQIAVLADLGRQDYMLVSPYPGQDTPVSAQSWGHQLKLDTADDQKLRGFIREYKQAPDTPEPGAACTSGTVTDLVSRG